jgi:hypothetical protein
MLDGRTWDEMPLNVGAASSLANTEKLVVLA